MTDQARPAPEPVEQRAKAAAEEIRQAVVALSWASDGDFVTAVAAIILSHVTPAAAVREEKSEPLGWRTVPYEPTDYMVNTLAKLKLRRITEAVEHGTDGPGIIKALREEWFAWLGAAPWPEVPIIKPWPCKDAHRGFAARGLDKCIHCGEKL